MSFRLRVYTTCIIAIIIGIAWIGMQLHTTARAHANNPLDDSRLVWPLTTSLAQSIAAGDAHSCAVSTAGTVKCWGNGGEGQLGDGSTRNRAYAQTISDLTNVGSVAAGDSHTCVHMHTGTVACWGANGFGQLGNGTTTAQLTPTAITGLSGVTAIAAGNQHMCALLNTGTVKCWGDNFFGQLGDGTTTQRLTPVTVTGLSGVRAIDAGTMHTCALLSTGTVKCWGSNFGGQIGDGTTTDRRTPVTVTGLSSVTSITVGSTHSCAVLSTGAVRCWGMNQYGEIGNGSSVGLVLTPVAVTGVSGATALSAGVGFTCALLNTGTVRCWGLNNDGQIGDTTTVNRPTATTVSSLTGVVALTSGNVHSCALLSTSEIKCWGRNESGQLGNQSVIRSSTPVTVIELVPVSIISSISAGELHTCARTTGNKGMCWGRNSWGQLGDGNQIDFQFVPVLVSGLSTITSIEPGTFHTCALLSTGTVMCWGYNQDGELGDGSVTNKLAPVAVSGLSGITAIAAGAFHTCAITSTRAVKCWGEGSGRQMGNGTLTSVNAIPVSVSNITDATHIAAGNSHTCVVTSTGSVMCWGDNGFYQSGGDSSVYNEVPVTIPGLSDVTITAVTAGTSHSCALTTSGIVRCWGKNDWGQLGNGTTTDQIIPVTVSGINNAVAIGAGGTHTCAIISGGTVKCWGENGYGQIGNGTTTEQLIPVNVNGVTGAAAITAGQSHTCVRQVSGEAMCWGFNRDGALGDGTVTDRTTAQSVMTFRTLSVGTLTATPTKTATSTRTLTSTRTATRTATATRTRTNTSTRTNTRTMTRSHTATATRTRTATRSNTRTATATRTRTATSTHTRTRTTTATATATATPQPNQLIAPGGKHTCVLTTSGAVACWGYNLFGQVGNGTTTSTLFPVAVTGLTGGVSMVSAGNLHTCAITTTNALKCWGHNQGRLGDGTATQRTTPVDVLGLTTNVAAVSASDNHTCALTTAGGVKCWGINTSGQLGDGTQTSRLSPVDVIGLTSGVSAITTGEFHSCALTSTGAVKCWGLNSSGRLGDGTQTLRLSPVDVFGLTSGVSAIAAGDNHTCALMSSGAVKCWGFNGNGQLGDSTQTSRITPVDVTGLTSGVAAITAGESHTCARTTAGAAVCWGYNINGQIGDGSFTLRTAPSAVAGLSSGVTALVAGESHTCAITSNNRGLCWGGNFNGEIGDGTLIRRNTPVAIIGYAP